MQLLRTLTCAAALVILGAAMTGCSDSTTQPPPGIQPEIINITDSFEYQVQSISGYTGTASYVWTNSGTGAAVDHSSVISGGVGMLVVYDAAGTEVYSGQIADSGSLVTQPGVAGDWTVQVSYSLFSGTVNFRVQKA